MSQYKQQQNLQRRRARYQRQLSRFPTDQRQNLTLMIFQKHPHSKLTPTPTHKKPISSFLCQQNLRFHIIKRKFDQKARNSIHEKPSQIHYFIGSQMVRVTQQMFNLNLQELRDRYADEQDGFLYVRFGEEGMRDWDRLEWSEWLQLWVFVFVMVVIVRGVWRALGEVYGLIV